MHILRTKGQAVSKAAAVRVWDLPTRLFHWLLLALFGFSWWSAEMREMDWHRISGIVVLGLVVFRLIWGFIGGNTARFGEFVRSPGAVIAYLRSDNGGPRKPGHNPIGGYSVVAMLVLLAVQLGTGLFAVDVDGIESGQLSFLVSFDQGRAAAEIHDLSFTLLQIVVAVHVAAILFYLFVRRRNLIHPMVSGRDGQLDSAAGALIPASPAKFAIAAVLSVAFAWTVWKGFWL
jgi:cytochrome b